MSGNTGFKFRYNLAGRTSGILRKVTIADSATITVGDYVRHAAGYCALTANGNAGLGFVVGIVDKNGTNMDASRLSLTGSGASWSSSTQTFVAGSDNSSTDCVAALIDMDPFSIFSATPDNTIGSTTGSNLCGYYTDVVAASDQPDEDTATTGTAQLTIWGVDPELSTNGLYSIHESQIP